MAHTVCRRSHRAPGRSHSAALCRSRDHSVSARPNDLRCIPVAVDQKSGRSEVEERDSVEQSPAEPGILYRNRSRRVVVVGLEARSRIRQLLRRRNFGLEQDGSRPKVRTALGQTF